MTEERLQGIRVLLVEDLAVDAERALHQLGRAGLACTSHRVETEKSLIEALRDFKPDVILSDFSLPQFDGLSALNTAHRHAPHVPFIFVSGTIGEERAINALRAGAVDYVLKENLARLAPAVKRAISEAEAHLARRRQEAQIAHLNRVLRMLSGVNGLVLRTRARAELYRETCRLAVSVGGYAAAMAVARVPGKASSQLVAWSCSDERMTESVRAHIAGTACADAAVIDRVIQSGRECIRSGSASGATPPLLPPAPGAEAGSEVILPLLVDNTAIAALALIARNSNAVSDDELSMLREVAGNLSFGLQYLQRDTKARFLSHFDPQTGLSKRPLFCERVQRLLDAPSNRASRHAAIVMDVERLTLINDSFSRHTGDLLLQHIADRLKRHFPQTEHLAHFGGGTFALVMAQGGLPDQEIKAAVMQQADKLFGEAFHVEGKTIPVAVRTAVAIWPEDGADATALVHNAEAALRYGHVHLEKHVRYDAAALARSVGQLELEHRLRFALERQEYELHYQPKVNVVTRRVQGVEALLRWRSPEDGLVSPGTFLPLLESTGLIVPVGEWVVQQAARDCQRWKRAGLPAVRVAVNIAPAQLRQPEFEAGFMDAVRSWSGRHWGLDIEITEGMLQDDSPAEIKVLKRLRDAGARIAIDDFGTGYSSLSRLAALPIDTLKIDRSFVSMMRGGSSGSSLVKTIISLARTFNMTTVAEGVETQEQLDQLWHLGCDQSQGFLHSPAMSADEMAHVLEHGKGVLLHAAEDSGNAD